MHNTDAHWRDSALTPKFFIIDARVCLPILLVLLHIRTWTVCVAIAVLIFFILLGRWRISVIAFFRLLRTFVTGNRKIRLKRRL
ncbi:IcmT/TraK family protein [Facilibium subflavum]|uniref:IcmT/TraK family protein n=1 Tax=Facilibium subflavum TaxID=2219058 RepID=UPI000E64CA78|nr:IcmT/TraK family protein [Facilibium subflavum]